MIIYSEFESVHENEGRFGFDALSNQTSKKFRVSGDYCDHYETQNQHAESLAEEELAEAILILHLIADAIACLKDKWVTKTEKVEAFDWIFAPLSEEVGGLKYYSDLIGACPKVIQKVASRFLVEDVKFANSVRFWW